MRIFQFLNGHWLVLEIKSVSLPDLKSQIRSRQKTLINKSRNFTENLRASVNKKNQIGTLQTRVCANCGEEKPLDKDHYQVVKGFKSGFSYYCNVCNAPKKRD